jgi:hypothetical protein
MHIYYALQVLNHSINYPPDENDDIIVIKNVNCYLDEPRLRDCSYSNYTIDNGQNCGGAGVRLDVR